MSRSALIVLVGLSAYCLLDLAISLVVAIVWRTRAVAPSNLPPTVRARRLLHLRLVPAFAALAITLLVVVPAFVIFEPPSTGEPVGPVRSHLSRFCNCLSPPSRRLAAYGSRAVSSANGFAAQSRSMRASPPAWRPSRSSRRRR